MNLSSSVVIVALDIDSQRATQRYALAMITTLMPHLRIGPYKEGVTIDQIQMPFHAVGRSFCYELLVIYIPTHIYIADMGNLP